jgi:hypothetical protein
MDSRGISDYVLTVR